MTGEEARQPLAAGDGGAPRTGVCDEIDDAVAPLVEALDAPSMDRVDAWRANLLSAMRAVAKRIGVVPVEAAPPEHDSPTAPDVDLVYRVAAEFTRVFPCRDKNGLGSDALSRGLLLYLWDQCWRAMRKDGLGGNAFGPEAYLARPVGPEDGRIVQPMLVRDAFCACDDDLSHALSGGGHGGDADLRVQLDWMLRRLHRTDFQSADRAALYMILRLRHSRSADREQDFPEMTVQTLVDAVLQTEQAIFDRGRTDIAEVPETAFSRERPESGEDDQGLMLETLQALQSVVLRDGAKLADVPRRLLDAARAFKCDLAIGEVALDEPALRRTIMRFGARLRMIRHAFSDLFGYHFPEYRRPEATPQKGGPGCDCWVSVIGHRQTGKTSFMTSLSGALLPDGTDLAPNSPPDWTAGRAQVMETAKL